MRWSDNPNDACIFWLNGMSGTGKSTIARTVAYVWDKEQRLGTSFFFSRGQGDLALAKRFFTTIAYQLARSQPGLADGIRKAICDEPKILEQRLRDQWEKLILHPLSQPKCQRQSLMLVIDALDECDGEQDTKLILQLLSEAKGLSSVRLQVFITSRPETHICHGFDKLPEAAHRAFVLHGIDATIVSHDIRAFLRHEFHTIRDEEGIQGGWPDEQSLGCLVRKADGLFIYAATICRFIGDKDNDPKERLNLVLEDSTEDGSPTAELDLMYNKILEHAIIRPWSEEWLRIVGSIVILFDSLTDSALAKLLGTKQFKVTKTLKSLSSVLEIQGFRIRLLHPSFRDFLLDNRRCSESQFCISEDKAHEDLAVSSLKLM
ncbi:hypothetical protein FN846DRAFT_819412, partial [Sphaerosporella brunnea]